MNRRARLLRTRVALCALAAVPACLNRPIDRLEPRTTSTVVEPLAQSRVERIDILLAIDNSLSMADKQQILATAVPDLVDRLITPNCVELESKVPTGQKADPKGVCPMGSEPEFRPVVDINIGIISSSLGDLTTGSCAVGSIEHADDKGHLLSRKFGSDTEKVPTYEDKGFLAWDPNDGRGGESSPSAIRQNLGDMVLGVDQLGCGFEMQLEAVYRFLADPDPYDSLTVDGNSRLQEVSTDADLLAQRRDFLRPDSLVAVIMLSDENDCSINIQGAGFQSVIDGAPFYRSTDECAADPTDPCCTSCALANPAGCAPDPDTCGPNQGTDLANRYTADEDQQGWRCSDQKRRYGINLLYPTKRYVNALTQTRIDPTRADLAVSGSEGGVQNPLLFGERDGVKISRPPGFVYLAGIVGVPWQAIAKKNDAGQPDLSLGFQTVEELEKAQLFEKLAGKPDENVAPSDPFMQETSAKRTATSDVLGVSPASANDINGGDRAFEVDDLQYACVFPLLAPQPGGRDCTTCDDPSCDDPLCEGTTQVAAKAYPGTRELAVIRGLGDQGIPASICPEQLTDTAAPNYGYAPAVRSIIDKLKENFKGKCLPRELKPSPEDGSVQCLVVEARSTAEGACSCDQASGRLAISPTLENGDANPTYNAVELAKGNSFDPGWNCFCEIAQLVREEGESCQQDLQTENLNGWCYVDPVTVKGSNPKLVEDCDVSERRKIRFVGAAEPLSGATAFITCTGE
ncbi:MAG: hypothetical protein JNL21_41790 [Myxococcales bacterium]|nr:hypothetical protein [Myxococcales bacterium]